MSGPLRREDHRWEVFTWIMGAEPPDWVATPYLDQELGPREIPDKLPAKGGLHGAGNAAYLQHARVEQREIVREDKTMETDTKDFERMLVRQMKKVLNLRIQLSIQTSHVAADLSRKALNAWDVTTIDQSQLIREAGKLDGMIEMLEWTRPDEAKEIVERANEAALQG